MAAKSPEGTSGDNANIIYLCYGCGQKTIYICQNSLNGTVKTGGFILWKLYLNETD